jgi:hypothetical protein
LQVGLTLPGEEEDDDDEDEEDGYAASRVMPKVGHQSGSIYSDNESTSGHGTKAESQQVPSSSYHDNLSSVESFLSYPTNFTYKSAATFDGNRRVTASGFTTAQGSRQKVTSTPSYETAPDIFNRIPRKIIGSLLALDQRI